MCIERENHMNKVRMGILGAGNIAGSMAFTVNKMEDATLYAVASRNSKKAEEFADKYHVEKYYGSYEEMLSDPNVDLVYVATPHSEHCAHVILCLEHGKAVLCEKAFAANYAQAKDMITLAREKKLLLVEAMWVRFMPMAKTIREVVESGVLGNVSLVTAGLGYPIEHVERLVNPELAGGALLDLGVYPINFASIVLGSQVKYVESSVEMTESGVDRQESISIHYEDGSMAVLNASMSIVCDRGGAIYGDKGYALIRNINNYEKITVYNTSGEVIATYDAPAQISGYEYQVEACVRALRAGETECWEMPHSETLRIMKMTDELRAGWGMKYPFED